MTIYYTPSRSYGRVASASRPAPVDVYRDGDSYVLTADLPGFDPKSVDVDVEGKVLTISAERVAPSAEGITWLARERGAGSFKRQFTLGDSVDANGIRASYDNGVLNVTVPVAERAKPRKVAVATGAAATAVASEAASDVDSDAQVAA